MSASLAVRDLWVAYGRVRALRGVNLDVAAGHVVALLGANGAGKSSLLSAISGLVPAESGSVELDGTPILGQRPSASVRRGLVHVPERRPLFGDFTVEENLRVAGYGLGSRAAIARALEASFAYFPILGERRTQRAATLSGGEQQMLVIARALVTGPRMLLLDEPSLGLAPLIVREIYAIIRRINEERGVTVIVAEPNVGIALSVADYAYVLETGTVVSMGTPETLQASDEVRRSYLGQRGAAR